MPAGQLVSLREYLQGPLGFTTRGTTSAPSGPAPASPAPAASPPASGGQLVTLRQHLAQRGLTAQPRPAPQPPSILPPAGPAPAASAPAGSPQAASPAFSPPRPHPWLEPLGEVSRIAGYGSQVAGLGSSLLGEHTAVPANLAGLFGLVGGGAGATLHAVNAFMPPEQRVLGGIQSGIGAVQSALTTPALQPGLLSLLRPLAGGPSPAAVAQAPSPSPPTILPPQVAGVAPAVVTDTGPLAPGVAALPSPTPAPPPTPPAPPGPDPTLPNALGALGVLSGAGTVASNALNESASDPRRILGALQGTTAALGAATQTPALQSIVPGLAELGKATTLQLAPEATRLAAEQAGKAIAPLSGLNVASGLLGLGLGALDVAEGNERGAVGVGQGALSLGLQAAHAAGLGGAAPLPLAAQAAAEAAAAGTSLAGTAGAAGQAAAGLGAATVSPALAAGALAAPVVAGVLTHQLATMEDEAEARKRVGKVQAATPVLHGLRAGLQGLQTGDDLVGWLRGPLPGWERAAPALPGIPQGGSVPDSPSVGSVLAALVQGNLTGQYGGWDTAESGLMWAPNPRWAVLVPFFQALGIEPAPVQDARNLVALTSDLSKGAGDYLASTAPAKWAPMLDALATVVEQAMPQVSAQAPRVDPLAVARQLVGSEAYAPPQAAGAGVPNVGRVPPLVEALLSHTTPDWLWRTLAADDATVAEAIRLAPARRGLIEPMVALARTGGPVTPEQRLRVLSGPQPPESVVTP